MYHRNHGLAPVATTCRHFVAQTHSDIVPKRTKEILSFSHPKSFTALHFTASDPPVIRISLADALKDPTIRAGQERTEQQLLIHRFPERLHHWLSDGYIFPGSQNDCFGRRVCE